MNHRLMTLLCFSLQSGDVTERAAIRSASHKALFARNGKLLSNAEADVDVFLFDSPTEAVLGATEVLQTVNSQHQTEARLVVHTTELDLDSSVLGGSAMSVALEMLERTPWGDLCVSESSYLSMQRSEVGNKVEETSWQLKTGNRKVIMYRIKARGGSRELTGIQASAELAALRRASKSAPYDRRVLSMLVDYFITVAILMAFMCTKTFPAFWKMVTSRYVVEFEDFDYEHALLDSYWRASNGLAVELASKAAISTTINVKRGYHDAYIVYAKGSPRLHPFKLKIGDKLTNVELKSEPSMRDSKPFARQRVGENLLLDGSIPISLSQSEFVPYFVVLDYFLLVPSGFMYSGRTADRTNRFEDIQRLLYIWDTETRNFILFNVFLVPPALWIFQALCLSLATWTPGYLLFRLRVVTLRGETPGPLRALKRCLAQFISVFCLGFGWIWPLISHDERTWSDMFSDTKVVILE